MYLLCDIGGTKMRVAFSKNGADFEKPAVIRTPAAFEEGMNVLRDTAETLVIGRAVRRVILGIPGVFDKKFGELYFSPNLPGWMHQPLQSRLDKMFGTHVSIYNDAELVGLGEAVFGAGRAHEIVAYFTVSTGVGGARIVGKKLDAHSVGFEPGHQMIESKKALTLEDMVGGGAMQKKYGREPYKVLDPDVWQEAARHLAAGIRNSVLHWSPDAVVLGGPMILGTPAIALQDIERAFKALPLPFPSAPVFLPAELDDFGGLYGGLAIVKNSSR